MHCTRGAHAVRMQCPCSVHAVHVQHRREDRVAQEDARASVRVAAPSGPSLCRPRGVPQRVALAAHLACRAPRAAAEPRAIPRAEGPKHRRPVRQRFHGAHEPAQLEHGCEVECCHRGHQPWQPTGEVAAGGRAAVVALVMRQREQQLSAQRLEQLAPPGRSTAQNRRAWARPHSRTAASRWALSGSATRPECVAQPGAWRIGLRR